MPGPHREASDVEIATTVMDLLFPDQIFVPAQWLFRAHDLVRFFKTTAYYREAHWGDAAAGYPVALAGFLMDLKVIEDPR